MNLEQQKYSCVNQHGDEKSIKRSLFLHRKWFSLPLANTQQFYIVRKQLSCGDTKWWKRYKVHIYFDDCCFFNVLIQLCTLLNFVMWYIEARKMKSDWQRPEANKINERPMEQTKAKVQLSLKLTTSTWLFIVIIY